MNRKHLVGAAALALLCTTGAALAATSSDDRTYGAQSTPPGWMSAVADQKLQAVDGSSLTVAPSESGLSLSVISPTGETQKNVYALMNDKLGTISDDGGHLIGVFRTTDKGFEAQFSDGHTELLTLNAAGGVSLTLASAQNGSACMAWYPPGHAFSDAERRAALAEYAQRLGLNDAVKAPHVSHCAVQATAAVAPPAHLPSKQQSAANDKGLVPVLVRTSVVHAVDGSTSAAPAAAMAAPKAPPVVSMPSLMMPASTRSPTQTASAEAVQPGHGASDCLSVENNGADLGFRNQCGFSVAFSYCLQKAEDPAIACDAGARAGDVAANDFVTLLPGANIKAADAEHDFRWVGCTGGAGEVVAHLDKTDPPAGRCVRTTAS